ncbi:apoptosis inducing factor isoform X2 [Arctopsyche grandis]|uniref:apoptosis inducing factor isoform X2 n=1 Tax=Arctopsyche grandis TaxID=121162 RepID=UPI00406D8DA0
MAILNSRSVEIVRPSADCLRPAPWLQLIVRVNCFQKEIAMLFRAIRSAARADRLCWSTRPPHSHPGWQRFYAATYKKKGPADPVNSSRKTSDLFRAKTSQDITSIASPISLKIVQVRSSSSQNTSHAKPPSVPSATFSSNSSNEKPPEKSNLLRNIIYGLVIAAASLGGVYYFDVLGGNKDDSKKRKPKSEAETRKSRPIIRNPISRDAFPEKMQYVLIGGGTASFAAFRAIKSKDPTAKVLVISAEDSIPYMRPPLSKEIWQQKDLPPADILSFRQWNGQERSLFYEPADFYMNINELGSSENGGVAVATGWRVSRIEPLTSTVFLKDPTTDEEFPIEYNKCLIATGSMPKNLPVFEKVWDAVSSQTILYRNIRDLENLWYQIQNAKSIAIVGGGFLGSELACSLGRKYMPDKKVFQMFKEPGNMGRVLPEYLSKWTTNKVIEEGVTVIPDVEVQVVQKVNNQVLMKLSDDSIVNADVVVVAVGSEPCTQLAEPSYLEVEPNIGGFLVNAELEARSNLYVAGDAACFYDPILGRRRVEHHDHAVVSGRLAGENMAGSMKPYKHQSMFWSDLGPDVGYEAIGIIDADLPTVSVFTKDSESGKKQLEERSDEKKSDNIQKETVPEVLSSPSEISSISVSEKEEKTEMKSNSDQDYSKGIIFYLKDDTVVGIVLWNVFNRMHIARQVLTQRKKYADLNELAKLFNLHEE